MATQSEEAAITSRTITGRVSEKIKTLDEQSRMLSNIRDSFLSELLSGNLQAIHQ